MLINGWVGGKYALPRHGKHGIIRLILFTLNIISLSWYDAVISKPYLIVTDVVRQSMRIHWLICSTMTMGGLRNGVFFVFVWCQFDHAFSPISLCHEWNHFPMNNIICVHSFGVYYAVHAVMHFYCAREFAIMCRFDGEEPSAMCSWS